MLIEWAWGLAEKFFENDDQSSFETWWLKFLVVIGLVWLALKVIFFFLHVIAVGVDFTMAWYLTVVSPYVQSVLHFFGGK